MSSSAARAPGAMAANTYHRSIRSVAQKVEAKQTKFPRPWTRTTISATASTAKSPVTVTAAVVVTKRVLLVIWG